MEGLGKIDHMHKVYSLVDLVFFFFGLCCFGSIVIIHGFILYDLLAGDRGMFLYLILVDLFYIDRLHFTWCVLLGCDALIVNESLIF